MELTEIGFKGYGRYEKAPGTFTCAKYHLPTPWEYVYTNGEALLRIRHDGAGFLQSSPPGGPALFKTERSAPAPMMFTWLVPDRGGAFSNFHLPAVPAPEPGAEPELYECTFAPDAATWRLERDGWRVRTVMFVPPGHAAAVMTITVTNASRARKGITLIPVVRPHLATFLLAPWDVPALYQTAAFCRIGSASAVWMETRNPGGDPSKRLRAAVVTDIAPDSFEVSCDRFVGRGEWTSPEAVLQRSFAAKASAAGLIPYGKATEANSVIGQPPIAAFAKTVKLGPGEAFTFSLVCGKLPDSPDGSLPPRSAVESLAGLLEPRARAKAQAAVRERYEALFSRRAIRTPDAALNRYAAEFLPMQLDWINMLDRGWPTGLRGTRDAAQDVTGAVPLEPELARRRLEEIFQVQRTDGWFVRQYSMSGPDGAHDARDYVDAGVWVWECLWEYLCYTRDFGFLKRPLRWLDRKSRSSVLEHARRIFDYYLARQNLGEHGLCKIREGDWNDSVNRAGVEGRGESVMVSCQAVLGLEQAAELFGSLGGSSGRGVSRRFRTAAERLRRNLLASALNGRGYFNGVFTDASRWVFSPKDPDGRRRVNGPANSFAVIAGVASGRLRASVMKALNSLKGPHGWRLFHPPIGNPPIRNLGRIGSGDLAPGFAENGTPYNHGSHGFLGRAAWTAGRGSMLNEITRYMLPYDQKAHPIDVQKTPPYAVVNHWKEAQGLDGHGGDSFLSGSISTCLRNLYQGMAGFRPGLSELTIDPVMPASWPGIEAELPFLGGRCRVIVHNPEGVECGVASCAVNGRPAAIRADSLLERAVAAVPMRELRRGRDCTIEVTLGRGRPERRGRTR